MIEYVTELVEREVAKKVICDRCGLERDPAGDDMIEIRHEYGFGSPRDTEFIEADICEKCFDEIIKNMHINVRRFTNTVYNECHGL